ncbi:MAG: hypothetical protein EBT03_07310 [Betaproteobacteria bacterium]|nr:hypothetical protein [Betaproteobacteria bacterium]NCA17119.1 hypothetical protein [Betaproteobacteria bacterium]
MSNFNITLVANWQQKLAEARVREDWKWRNSPKHSLQEDGGSYAILLWLSLRPLQTGTMFELREAWPGLSKRQSNKEDLIWQLVRELRSDSRNGGGDKLGLVIKS